MYPFTVINKGRYYLEMQLHTFTSLLTREKEKERKEKSLDVILIFALRNPKLVWRLLLSVIIHLMLLNNRASCAIIMSLQALMAMKLLGKVRMTLKGGGVKLQ